MNFIQKLWDKFVPKKPESSKQAKSELLKKEKPVKIIPRHEPVIYRDFSSKDRGKQLRIIKRRKANKIARKQRKVNSKYPFAA